MDPKEARERMAASPFAPLESANEAARQQHAANYSAYYLGQIAESLEKLVQLLESGNTNSREIASAVTGIAHQLPTLLKK